MNNTILNRKAYKYALKLQMRKQYPATIIGAGKSYFKKIERSQPISPLILTSKLREKLISIGDLFSKQNGNFIGCCSEVNAANYVLLKLPYLNLNEIIFSPAIRPRTMQKIPTCKNCQITFS